MEHTVRNNQIKGTELEAGAEEIHLQKSDPREVIRRGYDVTAFDCSSTAVRWAQDLDPGHAMRYVHANLFTPPPRWVHRFDLVTEVSNLEFLPPGKRADAISALSRLMSPHGYLLVVCRGADHEIAPDAEPPWPLTKDSLVEAAAAAGLVPEGPVCCFTDEVATGVKRIRAVFRRR